ncbi:MAG: hypothetical protein KKD39_08720 [Candidatus Altiarchaeota archaeon]|nr:hypothetical protein [Candidatus Altiarchaeota archaeon]
MVEKNIEYTLKSSTVGDIELRGQKQGQLTSLRCLVHPHSQHVSSYDELLQKRRKYLDYIRCAAEDTSCGLIFVGTADPMALAKLSAMEPTLKNALTKELPETDERGRHSIANRLRNTGIYIPPTGEYGYMDELSLLLTAVDSVDKTRLLYFQSQVDPKTLKRKLRNRINAETIEVIATGEKPEVCVKQNAKTITDTLDALSAKVA